MLAILGAVADCERAMIRERRHEGIAKAKSRGAYKGRLPKLLSDQVAQARSRTDGGTLMPLVARELGVARSTMHKHLKKTAASPRECA